MDHFIFCVGQHPERIRHFQFFMRNRGVPLTVLRGSYQGQRETSFMAPMSYYRTTEAWLREEESILLLEADDPKPPKATLIFLKEGSSRSLGRFVETTRSKALREQSWTYNPSVRRYYVCKMI